MIGHPPWLEERIAAVRATTPTGGRDRALVEAQVFLSVETALRLYAGVPSIPATRLPGARPELERTVRELVPNTRPGLATAAALTRGVARLVGIPLHGADRSEEEILLSGEATPIERARVLAALATTTGLAARVALLYRDAEPALHAVCELGIMASWTVFDPLAGQYFIMTHRPYASVWDIVRNAAVVDRHPEHGRKPTIDSSFYRTAAIAPAGDAA